MMEKVTHTPGPWTAKPFAVMDAEKTQGIGIYVGDDCLCDLVYAQGWSEKQVQANARLIAAAPELLAALKLLLNRASVLDQSATHDGLQNIDALVAARMAIEKAMG